MKEKSSESAGMRELPTVHSLGVQWTICKVNENTLMHVKLHVAPFFLACTIFQASSHSYQLKSTPFPRLKPAEKRGYCIFLIILFVCG